MNLLYNDSSGVATLVLIKNSYSTSYFCHIYKWNDTQQKFIKQKEKTIQVSYPEGYKYPDASYRIMLNNSSMFAESDYSNHLSVPILFYKNPIDGITTFSFGALDLDLDTLDYTYKYAETTAPTTDTFTNSLSIIKETNNHYMLSKAQYLEGNNHYWKYLYSVETNEIKEIESNTTGGWMWDPPELKDLNYATTCYVTNDDIVYGIGCSKDAVVNGIVKCTLYKIDYKKLFETNTDYYETLQTFDWDCGYNYPNDCRWHFGFKFKDNILDLQYGRWTAKTLCVRYDITNNKILKQESISFNAPNNLQHTLTPMQFRSQDLWHLLIFSPSWNWGQMQFTYPLLNTVDEYLANNFVPDSNSAQIYTYATTYPVSLVHNLKECEHIGTATDSALTGDEVPVKVWTELNSEQN